MSLWFHQLYPNATLYLNEQDTAIYKLFTCIKDEYAAFCHALEEVETDIDVHRKERPGEEPWMTKKRGYYVLRNWFYNQTQEPTDDWEPSEEEMQTFHEHFGEEDVYLKRYCGSTYQELVDKGLSERERKNIWSQAFNGFTEDEWEEMSGKNTPTEHAWYFYLRKLSFSAAIPADDL